MMVTFVRMLCIVSVFVLASVAGAQEGATEVEKLQQAFAFDTVTSEVEASAKPPASSTQAQPLSEATLTHEFRMRQQTDKYRFALLLAVTALLAHVVALVFLSRQRGDTRELGTSIMTSTGLVYVIFGTILIVVISSTDQQLTAAIGIMGAVAGYLFGRSRTTPGEGKPEPDPGPPRI